MVSCPRPGLMPRRSRFLQYQQRIHLQEFTRGRKKNQAAVPDCCHSSPERHLSWKGFTRQGIKLSRVGQIFLKTQNHILKKCRGTLESHSHGKLGLSLMLREELARRLDFESLRKSQRKTFCEHSSHTYCVVFLYYVQ